MSNDYKTYANFNALTVQGRVMAAELVSTKTGEFLSVTVITNPVDDSEGMTVTFNNSNGLLALQKKGGLPVGRVVTVTGHIASIHETYTNKAGEVVMLKRPRIHLVDAAIPTGGLGATPKSESARPAAGTVVVNRVSKPAADPTPNVTEEPAEALF